MGKLTALPEYYPWAGMVHRCTNPKNSGWKRYGGRGIVVSDEWIGREGFLRFRGHIGPRPSPKHQIDRINNSFGYVSGNVRWATTEEQARNRSTNVHIEFDGKRMVAADWAAHLGISRQSLDRRLARWPLDQALSRKAARRKIGALPAKPKSLTPAAVAMIRWAADHTALDTTCYAMRDGASEDDIRHGPLGSIRSLASRLTKAGLLSRQCSNTWCITEAGRIALQEAQERTR